jgi:hypothetical protein
MSLRYWLGLAAIVLAFGAGFILRGIFEPEASTGAGAAARLFELRTYTTPPGTLDALHARFRHDAIRLFDRHHMTSIGYWTPHGEPRASDTLVQLLAHPSHEAARQAWAELRADPEWVDAEARSEVNGSLTTNVESVFLDPTDYSPIL